MRPLPALGVLSALALIAATALAAECDDDPAVVEQCFTTHGRLRTTAEGHVDLWPSKSHRLYLVEYPPGQAQAQTAFPYMPPGMAQALARGATVYGDFIVCPFTHDEPGRARFVCIQSGDKFLVQGGRDAARDNPRPWEDR
jgi:hypothetical protein